MGEILDGLGEWWLFMRMNKMGFIQGTILLNLGIFIGTIALLPQKDAWSSEGPLTYFVYSRDRWDIAWGVLIATMLISLGVFLLLQAKGAFIEYRQEKHETNKLPKLRKLKL